MIVGNLAINSIDCRIRLSLDVSSGLGSNVYISRTLRARIFIILCPSRSRIFIVVFCSKGIDWLSKRVNVSNSSLSGKKPERRRKAVSSKPYRFSFSMPLTRSSILIPRYTSFPGIALRPPSGIRSYPTTSPIFVNPTSTPE